MLTSVAVSVVYIAVYARYGISVGDDDADGGIHPTWTAWLLESARYVH